MQEKSNQNQINQVSSLSEPLEKEKQHGWKKMASNFVTGMTIVQQNQSQYSEFDERGAIDYDDLSKQSKQDKYLNFAKIVQKKRIAQKQLQLVKAKFKAQLALKQKLLLQLQSLTKYKQIKEDSTKNSLEKQLQNIANQVFYQQELKKSLQSEVQVWQSINRLQQEQINAFPVLVKDQVKVMENEKQSLSNQRQKIKSLLALQEVFMGNLQQIIEQFP